MQVTNGNQGYEQPTVTSDVHFSFAELAEDTRDDAAVAAALRGAARRTVLACDARELTPPGL